jgi:hypothetical protein
MGHNQALRVGQFSMQILGHFSVQINSLSLVESELKKVLNIEEATTAATARLPQCRTPPAPGLFD